MSVELGIAHELRNKYKEFVATHGVYPNFVVVSQEVAYALQELSELLPVYHYSTDALSKVHRAEIIGKTLGGYYGMSVIINDTYIKDKNSMLCTLI